MEQIKEILTEQLKLLREESKELPADELSKLSFAMCEIARTIKELK